MNSDDLTFKFALFFVLSAFVEFALIWYTAIKFETIATPVLSYLALIGIPAAFLWLVNKYLVKPIKDEARKQSVNSALWMLIEFLLQALAVFLVAYAAH